MTNKEVKEDKVDQTEAMEIVEDEATKQQRLVKETITGKEPTEIIRVMCPNRILLFS
jgi:hypothetical protein